MKKSIIWLASYPKSGNTWMRIFLANYLANRKEPLPINEVHRFAMGDSMPKAYHAVAGRKIDVSNIGLTVQLRDKVLRAIIANNADVNFVKTHNIRSGVSDIDLIPANYTRSAIYILRNPLDLVLSYSRHFALTIDDTIEHIASPDNANAPEPTAVAQFLGSWSGHVESWTSKSPYPVLVLKYEDMLAEPHDSFSRALRLIGVPIDAERLDRAVRFSSFEELSSQEEKGGFKEASPNTDRFFAKGQRDQWKTVLSEEQIERIRKDHGKVMKAFGYL